MRRFVVVAALVAATVPVPVAHALPAASVTVSLAIGGGGSETTFSTVAGEPYLVTVTGTYTIGLTEPADCAWLFSATGPIEPNPFPSVDGHQAGCTGQPYNAAHTYQWTEIGTGAPLYFDISRGGYESLTDLGGLTFTVTGARAEASHDVTSFCFPHREPTALLDYTPVVVEAGAQAVSSGAVAMSTYVACDVTTTSGETARLRLGLPGPLVETAALMFVPPGDAITVCWWAGAVWDDGVPFDAPSRCVTF